MGSHQLGGFDELCGSVELAFGMDDLRSSFALGFGLLGHGTEHGLGHVNLLDFDGDDFNAEGSGVAVDDGLDSDVEGFAVGQEAVEVDFSEDGAQGGLGELRGLVDVVCDFDDGLSRVDNAKGVITALTFRVTLSRVMTS